KGLGVLSSVFFPILLGVAFAFIFNIPMSFLEKKISKILNKISLKERTSFMIRRSVSLAIVIIVFISIAIITMNILIPQVVQSMYSIIEKIPTTIKELENFFRVNIKNTYLLEWIAMRLGQVDSNIVNILNNVAQAILNSIIDITFGVTTTILNSIIGIIIAIYILLDKEKLKSQLKLVIYRISNDKYSKMLTSILKLTYYKLRKYIGGQATDATILFLMVFVSMTIFKMPYALLISSIVGVSAIVPIFGPFIGALISILIMFIGGYDNIVWFIVLVIVMQQIEGNIIYPIVVGSSIGLSSLNIIVAVIVFSSLFGILGIILGIPLFGVFCEILSKYIKKE
ncbi:AI-2E family transporter, partial [Bacillus cereus]|uniref:AI-2E family transporter n=1 Tax=Bacillus cereus TaxID=1396 RepID=UPI00214A191B